ncbi:uncharacterized protein LOC106050687 [Biomphalaria glabrata]|uniref:Uncharacterized protein LOC106050687 n=1 Tax=Biomphalaria glabrata TaxID=6526 RepID=A0A9W2Z6Y2_BIOGL|nr:uncharacterized protein LOC106050687 [Biomphalaria glabrata]KAI8738823.1 hypothetical protein BgiMline_024556 [Biomphalaria glabrata]
MSSYYYKVTPPPKPPVMIGTKRISQEELVDVVARLSRPSSAKMSGLTNSQQTTSSRFKKRVELDLERFLRRIQRPTLSHQLSRQRAETTMDSDSRPATAPRPLSRVELDKVLTQLSRSTAASRAKSAVECHLCGERDRELNKQLVPFVYPHADDRAVSEEEAGAIVARVSSATKSSERGGAAPCPRVPPDLDAVHALSRDLPLLSGLRRSKSVAEVVHRLYSSQGRHGLNQGRRPHKFTPQATPISGPKTT